MPTTSTVLKAKKKAPEAKIDTCLAHGAVQTAEVYDIERAGVAAEDQTIARGECCDWCQTWTCRGTCLLVVVVIVVNLIAWLASDDQE